MSCHQCANGWWGIVPCPCTQYETVTTVTTPQLCKHWGLPGVPHAIKDWTALEGGCTLCRLEKLVDERDSLKKELEASRAEVGALKTALESETWNTEDDRAVPEENLIKAAFPTRTNRHDLYARAMELVSAKRSKFGLIALVNWLLAELDTAKRRKK